MGGLERRRILEKLKRMLEGRGEVILAVVYGSFTKGGEFRDVDLAVYLKPGVDPLRYALDLEGMLEEALGYPVDVKPLNEAPAWFIKRVLEEGEVLLDRARNVERLYLKALDEGQALRVHLDGED